MAGETGIETLNYNNRSQVVLHHFGGVVRVLSLLSLMPLLFTLVARAWHHVIPCGLTTTVLILTGGLLRCLPGTGNIQHNEALNDRLWLPALGDWASPDLLREADLVHTDVLLRNDNGFYSVVRQP